uniref:Uncharacterized protein n=1 Tax=Timema monikensis TaxID=170555 RepID=A0A7R9HKV4_9NEOP|nr:unnamed protein product [Timema monikensis]
MFASVRDEPVHLNQLCGLREHRLRPLAGRCGPSGHHAVSLVVTESKNGVVCATTLPAMATTRSVGGVTCSLVKVSDMFSCQGAVSPLDLEDRRFFHQSHAKWERVPGRNSAWRLRPNSYIWVPSTELFPPPGHFPKEFSLLVTLRLPSQWVGVRKSLSNTGVAVGGRMESRERESRWEVGRSPGKGESWQEEIGEDIPWLCGGENHVQHSMVTGSFVKRSFHRRRGGENHAQYSMATSPFVERSSFFNDVM